MKRRPITEEDKLKEAYSTAKRISSFIDEELERWWAGNIDRPMLCAGMGTWIASWKEIFRIQHAKREKELKWKAEGVPDEN